ncbi:GntR family transcriptional regulator [Pseudonocardia sp. GCM10023141]|uniref:GntR family transcriptional regulator n=1 Tax=Pseudonocardia sp. GCM10023141 TaxID=3252653 RepID=UPI00360610BB
MAPRGTYRQIADEIRLQVQGGELPPGILLPSELALVERHGVSRGTVRSALTLLAEEGLIEVVPGHGRRVVGAVETSPTTAWQRIAAALKARLETGDFGPDEPLPSEADIVAEYGVSRNTARRAYRHLAETGAVVIRQGAGAYPALGSEASAEE